MKTTLWNELLRIPSATSLISRIVDGLADQVSQLLLIPATVESDLIYDALRAETLRRDFFVDDIRFIQEDDDLTLATFTRLLQSAIDDDSSKAFRLEDVLRHPALPEVIFLVGVEHLSGTSQKCFLEILSQWSRISQNALEQGESCSTACCIAFAGKPVIESAHSEVHLNVEWWWGVPSMLEMALLCRRSVGEYRHEAKAVWIESLAPSLCAGDVTFVAEMWSFLLEPQGSIWRRTREYGEQLGWERDVVENVIQTIPTWHVGLGSIAGKIAAESTLAPPLAFRPSWAKGIVQFTLEAGCELHLAALAIAGRIEALEQRMWRAQAALLLPKLDMIRHSVCRQMAQRYGPEWPTRWCQPRSEDEFEQLKRTHLACQWGYLEHLLRSCSHFRAERRLVPAVSSCRRIRNELAHYRPIEFSDFKAIWRHITPFGQ